MTGRLTGLGLTRSMHTRYSWTPGMLARERMQHEHALVADCTPAMSAPGESPSALRDDTVMPVQESTEVRGHRLGSVTSCGTDPDLPVPAAGSHE